MKRNKKSIERVRDLRPNEVWDEAPEVLTIEQLKSRENLARYYARRAGHDVPSCLERAMPACGVTPVWLPFVIIGFMLLVLFLAASCVSTSRAATLPGQTSEYLQENPIYKGQIDEYSTKTYMRTGTYYQANPIYKGQIDIKTTKGKGGKK